MKIWTSKRERRAKKIEHWLNIISGAILVIAAVLFINHCFYYAHTIDRLIQ